MPTTTAAVTSASAKKTALKAAGTAKATASSSRKVVWAAGAKPVLAYESVVKGLQHDGTPSELHVITDARTGKKIYSYEAVETGTGTSQYSGTVTIGTTASSSGGYDLIDGGRGGHKTYDLNGGTSAPAPSSTTPTTPGATAPSPTGRRPPSTPPTAPPSPGTSTSPRSTATASRATAGPPTPASTTATRTSTRSGTTAASA